MGGHFTDLTGKTFGRWTVKHLVQRSPRARWMCECSCKNKTLRSVYGYSLRNGDSTSCGCHKSEVTAARNKAAVDRSGEYNFSDCPSPDAMPILLTQGKVAWVDADVYEEVSKYNWNHCKGYPVALIDGKNWKLSRYIAKFFMKQDVDDFDVDHKNGNTYDNTIKNLRVCEHSNNCKNSLLRKDNQSGYKGVYWRSDKNKWSAEIVSDGVKYRLGYFKTAETAAEAYRLKSLELHGEYSVFNR